MRSSEQVVNDNLRTKLRFMPVHECLLISAAFASVSPSLSLSVQASLLEPTLRLPSFNPTV